jgi:ABC-type multidrug transport system fused ATPase/permease subunit
MDATSGGSDTGRSPAVRKPTNEDRLPIVPTPRERYTGIEFSNVNFAYSRRPTNMVLKNLSLSIAPNSITGIVGRSGAGKSTIMALIAGLHTVNSGTITINGTNVRDKSREWVRSQVGVVEQTASLLSGTIAENIAYGKVSYVVIGIIQPRDCVTMNIHAGRRYDG